MWKNKYFIAVLLVIVIIVSGFYFILTTPVVLEKNGFVYDLLPGKSKKAFIKDLTNAGFLKHPIFFSIYVFLQSSAPLKKGEYHFPQGATLSSIWRQVSLGRGFYYRSFTIIPGWSFAQLRTFLDKTERISHQTKGLSDAAIMGRLGYPLLSAEGEFFPDTYFYTKNTSDLSILQRAFKLMQSKLNKAWQKRALNSLLERIGGPYAALIAASLVEKEAHLAAERPIIAGVLFNRLKHHMPLQFDPTIIYAMGPKYHGKIYKGDLHENSPYNTYLHTGLPPTPIAIPSFDSIWAVLHPAAHDFFYFVVKGEGRHHFSKTLVEHETAVKLFKEKLPHAK